MTKESLARSFKARNISKHVIDAFLAIDRTQFVLPEWKSEAYEDSPLPIPADQTISQPTTVVMMIDALELKKNNTVLEIGAGSGYNAALMSKIAQHVYSVERIYALYKFAKENLEKAGIANVTVIHGDGKKGYPPEQPYDRIIVTAAGPKIPGALLEQLKDGGVLLMPVGPTTSQELIRVRRKGKNYQYEKLGSYLFVPLR